MPDNTAAGVLELTGGVGVDVSIGAVGYPETLLTAASLVRPSGAIASVGVYGVPVSLPMQDMWIQNVTLTMGLVDTVSIPTLLKMVASGRIPAEKMALIRSPSPRWTRPTTCLRTPPRTPPSRW